MNGPVLLGTLVGLGFIFLVIVLFEKHEHKKNNPKPPKDTDVDDFVLMDGLDPDAEDDENNIWSK